MSPTIRDVARLAEVSVATASRVLSKSDYPVAAEVRHRVLQAAGELDFTPNAFARGLSNRKCPFIGLVVPNIREPFFLEMARGIEDLISRYGYMLIVGHTGRDLATEQKYLQEFRALRAGVILIGRSGYSEEARQALAGHPAPIVSIGRHEINCCTVALDNLQGAMEATSHLIRLGRRRIAFIGGPQSSLTAMDRLEGYRRALEQHGLTAEAGLVVEGDFTLEGGVAAMDRLLEGAVSPDALFAANDATAIGALRQAKGRGLRIPKDLAVVGFNDVPIAAFVDPPLTTVHLPLRRIGEIAAELLLRQLETPEAGPCTVHIAGELVVRGSTVPPA